MAELNRTGLHRFTRTQLSARALAAAQGGADTLREKLSGPGTGRHHPGQPRRSSRPDEYPAEQTGALRDSVAARPAGPGQARFGLIDHPPPYVNALHFRAPADGGRPVMDDALADRDVLAAVLDGARR